MANSEIDIKLKRLGEYLAKNRLDGVLLQERANFAWITGGRDNKIPNCTPQGVAAIYATANSRVCLTNTIEAPRMKKEELVGTGIEVVEFPWWDSSQAKQAVRQVLGGAKVACDIDALGLGLPAVPGDFAQLRFSLTSEEIARYRQCCQAASRAMEETCQTLKPGMSEHEIGGLLDHNLRRYATNPVVTLVAVDERIHNFRHPIPTDKKLARYVMMVTCTEMAGLIANVTRFVHFGPISEDIHHRQQAVCNVDAAVNLATRPGKTMAWMFGVVQKAYADNGFDGEWKLHHQGGPTGYGPRESIANGDNQLVVLENQAFAWNPSITGTKSEDTILCTGKGIEVLTACSANWPKITGRSADGELARADILVR